MEKLLALLNEIQPGVDYGNRTDLIDGHILESLSILSLVAAIEDTFDIMFDTDDIIGFSSYDKGLEILKKYDICF